MTKKNTGLGKGLDALFGMQYPIFDDEENNDSVNEKDEKIEKNIKNDVKEEKQEEINKQNEQDKINEKNKNNQKVEKENSGKNTETELEISTNKKEDIEKNANKENNINRLGNITKELNIENNSKNTNKNNYNNNYDHNYTNEESYKNNYSDDNYAEKRNGINDVNIPKKYNNKTTDNIDSNGKNEKIYNIEINKIEPNRDQPRRSFNEESIEELAESIKRYGIIQPIVVNKKDDYYEIIAGERRWRAAKKAGLTEMPCVIRVSTERENREIALIENIQREDLNPIEKARSFRKLLDEYGMTQQELANAIGISRSALTNTVRLLNMDPRVIDLVLEGKLTEGHCRSLMAIVDHDQQYEMALQIIENGDSVREIERKVKNKKAAKNVDNKYEAVYKDIENKFQNFFGSKVKLNAGKKKGKIIIEYVSNEDLERILELLDR